MKRMPLFAACLVITACGGGQDAEFKDGFPSADTVKLEVPETSSTQQPLEGTGVQKQGLQGETADFYKLTRLTTVAVNVGVGVVLGLVKAIVDQPATSVSGNVAVWGPYTDQLSPNTWKLTVTRNAPHDFTYSLQGKPKQAGDSAYVTVLSGHHLPAVDAQGNVIPNEGDGTFLLDWDAAQTLPEHDQNVGKAAVTYSRHDAPARVTIDVNFTQTRDAANNKLIDSVYKFEKEPGVGGQFQYSVNKDVQNNNSQAEHLTIRSRWQDNGAGRSDVKATGGDLITDATANECWDQNFASTWLSESWAPFSGWGTESTCVFPTADYSDL
jgi:hypothetical protein